MDRPLSGSRLTIWQGLGLALAVSSLSFSSHALVNGQTELPSVSSISTTNHTLSVSSEQTESALVTSEVFRFSEPGASFIKVHFRDVVLVEGAAIEVVSSDGSERYVYSAKHNTPMTIDSSQGDDGVTQFAAMSIAGDAVEVALIGEGSAVVDYIQVGLPQGQLEQVINASPSGEESICGSDNKQAVACFDDKYGKEVAHSKPVARILIGGRSLCTAWRVGPNNHMMTNNHCIESASEAANTEVWFNYQLNQCGGSRGTVVKVQADKLLETGYDLDFSLFTVKNFSTIQSFGYLGLDPRIPSLLETIYIPQHPGGRLKELGVETDSGARCVVDRPVTNGRGSNTDSGYLCDTEGGSSGSPVLAASSHRVVALHHLGGCYNKGAHISKIWPLVSSHFPAGVPTSNVGSPSGGNQAPIAQMDVNCTALSCQFNANQSSDSDGNIANYSWRFGDGASSQGVSVSHSYVSSGQYTVTLTVTDNQGLSDSTTQVVSVQDSSNGTCGALTSWSASQTYLGGDNVQHQGSKYQAKWWTRGDNPADNSAQWDVWTLVGACQ
ncbi:PKD domain-containing protein [Vibrio maritimus]